MKCEPADERAVGRVQLDRRRQTEGGEIGPRPDNERAILGGRRVVGRDEIGQRRHRVDLIHRLLDAALQVFALVECLGSINLGHEPLFGVNCIRDERWVGRQRRGKEGHEQRAEARGLRGPAHVVAVSGHSHRAGAGCRDNGPHRKERHQQPPSQHQRGAQRSERPGRRGDVVKLTRAPPARERCRRAGDDDCRPDRSRVQDDQGKRNGEPRRLERVQREMQHVERGVRDQPAQRNLVNRQDAAGDQPGGEMPDEDAGAPRASIAH